MPMKKAYLIIILTYSRITYAKCATSATPSHLFFFLSWGWLMLRAI